MKMLHPILTFLMISSVRVQAAPDYIVVFEADARAADLVESEAKIRTLSTETGNGDVKRNPRHPRLTANLTEAAAEEVKRLPGVAKLFVDVQLSPAGCSSAMDAPESANERTVVLEPLTPDARQTLIAEIRSLASEMGPGFVLVFADDALFANLSDAAVEKVLAMKGVAHVGNGRLSMQQRSSETD